MLYLVRALVYLLQTAVAAAGVDLALNDSPTPPQGGTLVGTTDVVQVGTAVLTFTRGTGPAMRTFWTGYWTASGN